MSVVDSVVRPLLEAGHEQEDVDHWLDEPCTSLPYRATPRRALEMGWLEEVRALVQRTLDSSC